MSTDPSERKIYERLCLQRRREAYEGGRYAEANGHLAEAKSWRAGKPQSDPRVPRARYRRENKAALANAVDPDRLIRELTEGKD
jgi:hypothetical protein